MLLFMRSHLRLRVCVCVCRPIDSSLRRYLICCPIGWPSYQPADLPQHSASIVALACRPLFRPSSPGFCLRPSPLRLELLTRGGSRWPPRACPRLFACAGRVPFLRSWPRSGASCLCGRLGVPSSTPTSGGDSGSVGPSCPVVGVGRCVGRSGSGDPGGLAVLRSVGPAVVPADGRSVGRSGRAVGRLGGRAVEQLVGRSGGRAAVGWAVGLVGRPNGRTGGRLGTPTVGLSVGWTGGRGGQLRDRGLRAPGGVSSGKRQSDVDPKFVAVWARRGRTRTHRPHRRQLPRGG